VDLVMQNDGGEFEHVYCASMTKSTFLSAAPA